MTTSSDISNRAKVTPTPSDNDRIAVAQESPIDTVVEVRQDVAGALVVRKSSTTVAGARRISAEASIAERLFLPGIIRLVDHGTERDTTWMETRFAGAGCLDNDGLAAEAAVRILVDCARVVSGLHENRWSHGSICRSHIIVNDQRRTTLCSLHDCSFPATEAQVRKDRDDLANLFDDEVAHLQQDMSNDLLTCTERMRSTGEPLWQLAREIEEIVRNSVSASCVDGRSTRQLRNPRSGLKRTVQRLIGRTPPPAPGRANSTDNDVPLEEAVEEAADRRAFLRRTKPLTAVSPVMVAVSAVALFAIAYVGIGALTNSGNPTSQTGVRPIGATSPTRTNDNVELPKGLGGERLATATPTQVTTAPDCDTTSVHRADPDGDGCFSSVTLDGNAIRVGDKWFQIGERGDISALGDFDCDASTDVAVLRPSTGELFLFREWPSSEPMQTNAVAVRAGQNDLMVKRGADGCDQLSTVRGSEVTEFPIPHALITKKHSASPTSLEQRTAADATIAKELP